MQGHILLLFINARGRNLPSVFAAYDVYRDHLSGEWNGRPGRKDEFAMFLRQEDAAAVCKCRQSNHYSTQNRYCAQFHPGLWFAHAQDST